MDDANYFPQENARFALFMYINIHLVCVASGLTFHGSFKASWSPTYVTTMHHLFRCKVARVRCDWKARAFIQESCPIAFIVPSVLHFSIQRHRDTMKHRLLTSWDFPWEESASTHVTYVWMHSHTTECKRNSHSGLLVARRPGEG